MTFDLARVGRFGGINPLSALRRWTVDSITCWHCIFLLLLMKQLLLLVSQVSQDDMRWYELKTAFRWEGRVIRHCRSVFLLVLDPVEESGLA